jgi:hypothetical protein
MASIITATTTNGLTQAADNSGVLQLASGAGNLITVPSATGTMLTNKSVGSVIQVVQGTPKSDTFSTTSTTLVDITGLSATITPTSASNKILVFVDLHIGYSVYAGIVHLLRGSTKIYAGDGGLTRCGLYSNVYANPGNVLIPVTAVCYDNPATTSATTYKLQTATYGAGTQYVNRTGDNINDPTRDGLTVSTITLMEIVA